MSSNGKKKKNRQNVPAKPPVPEKKPINLKRNIAIIAVFVVLAAAALAVVYYIASSHGADVEPTNPTQVQSPSDAESGSSFPAGGEVLVEYRDGKLPIEFVTILNEAEADSAAANKEYGTAMTIDGVKISVPEFLVDYCDIYASTVNETTQTILESGINKMGFDIEKTPVEQTRQDGEQWSERIAQRTGEKMQEIRAKFYAAVSAGYTMSKQDMDGLYNMYISILSYAVSKGQTSDEFLSQNYGKGVTFAMFAARDIMDTYGTFYMDSVARDAFDSCTEKEIQAAFDANPSSYYRVNVRIVPLEDTGYDKSAAANVKSEKDFLKLAQDVNGQYYENYDADAETMYYGTSYDSIDKRFGGEVASWIFDNKRQPGNYAVVKGTIYRCAVLILDTKYLGSSVDYRGLYIPFNSSYTAAQSEDERNQALETAKGYYKEWKDGEATEESFAGYCSTYSQDTYSNANGGLVEALRVGAEADVEIQKWCFNEKRVPGDCEVIETDSGVVVLYFVRKNPDDLDWKYTCKTEKGDKVVAELEEELLENSSYGFSNKGKNAAIDLGEAYARRRIERLRKEASQQSGT